MQIWVTSKTAMSDFLISRRQAIKGDDLLELLRQPYRNRRLDGEGFDFPWGSLAVFQERRGQNIRRLGDTLVTWVGDLVTEVTIPFLESLVHQCRGTRIGSPKAGTGGDSSLALDQLNGSFAFVIADTKGCTVITDLMNYVQVYAAKDARGEVVALGTHPDLVATVGEVTALDFCSLGEFLNSGTPLFPNTAYLQVQELHLRDQDREGVREAEGADRVRALSR